jgi:octanoyl-[GcvH]:protein N-octanoyltransferase
MEQKFNFEHIRFLDHSKDSQLDAKTSFAIDDALCLSVGENLSPPTARLWVHDNTVVLGIPDSRLPHLMEGVQFLQEQGYRVIIRNSGGLAVLLDKGVLNLTLVLQNANKLSIDSAYEMMVAFIRDLLGDEGVSINAYEVVGSYCPGDYDLSINGKKFAGISQRRVKNGVAVQIYLCVEGNGAERAKLIKVFYEISIQGKETSFTYPEVRPETMASLQQLLNRTITVEELCRKIKEKLVSNHATLSHEPLQGKEVEWFEVRFNHMLKRNEKIL